MRVVLCLTRCVQDWAGIRKIVEEIPATALMGQSPGELLQALGSLDPDLLLVDFLAPRDNLQMLLGLGQVAPTVVMVLPAEDMDGGADLAEVDQMPEVYDSFCTSEDPSRQRKIILRALERSSLILKDRPAASPPAAAQSERPTRSSDLPWERALRSLSRTLSAGFDTRGLTEPFLDLVVELFGVARVSLLTLDSRKGSFAVAGERGLHSPMLHTYTHSMKSKLVEGLMHEGRPLRRTDAALRSGPGAVEIQRSFDALQATVCIPMAAMGRMVGILALGTRLNGSSPTDDQVEMLFTTGSHVAVALQNIGLHHETAWQEAQHESVLEHMTNGIAAIDESGKITVLNRRAADILRVSRDRVLGRDLRTLPAPLGDYLFNTMQTGEVTQRMMLALPGSGIPLEVSSYPLTLPDRARPVGSVLVLEEITERLALDESRRHADRQEVFTRLISQLAHEIKNPLSAVKTFADLFPEHLKDPDFVEFINVTVIPEILRLDSVVGRLVDFVDQNSLQVQNCDVRPIIRDTIQRFSAEAESAGVKLVARLDDPVPLVRADPVQLPKALLYILRHIVFNIPRDVGAEIRLSVQPVGNVPLRLAIEISSDRPWIREDEIDHVFDPLYIRKEQLNLSLPAARKIILEHGGEIETVVGADSRIRLRIILRVAEGWTDATADSVGALLARV